MDRARGTRISPVLLFVAVLAIALVGMALLLLLPILGKLAWLLFGLIPIAVTIAGIASLLIARKPANITLLWIIIMVLAPFLGPLLWFAWGRRNT